MSRTREAGRPARAGQLQLGDGGLDLPLASAATQVYAFMGRRGSGKSYAAGRLVEQLLEHGVQVVVIDPVGIWWGLRFLADGRTSSGFVIPVFGGARGDLPLPATSGKVLAELVAQRSTSVVLDVSNMLPAEQRKFVGEFAAAFLHAKKAERSPVLLVFEEAQEFVPQHVRGEVAKMVGAVERLIKLGRNYGVGAALISQRPQAVNKDVLNQAEVMLALQLTGPQERKAIAGWVQQTGAGDRGIADDLPGLERGTAMVWSPQWLGKFGRHRILRKVTYDAGATPEEREGDARLVLPPIDLEALRTVLASIEEEEPATAEVATLKAELRRLRVERSSRPVVPAPVQVRRVEVVPPALLKALRAIERETGSLHDRLEALSAKASELADVALEMGQRAAAAAAAPQPPAGSAPHRQIAKGNGIEAAGRAAPATVAAAGSGDPHGLPKGALRLLATLKERHPDPLSAKQLAALCVMTHDGGTFKTYMGKLARLGLIVRDGGVIVVSVAGQSVPTPPAPLEKRALITEWREKLPGRAKDMLETIAIEHEVQNKELAERFNMTTDGGTWKTYVGKIIGLGLVTRGRGTLRIHPELAL